MSRFAYGDAFLSMSNSSSIPRPISLKCSPSVGFQLFSRNFAIYDQLGTDDSNPSFFGDFRDPAPALRCHVQERIEMLELRTRAFLRLQCASLRQAYSPLLLAVFISFRGQINIFR